MKLYGIKNCGSVKKGGDFLDAHGIQYAFFDFKKQPPTKTELDTWCATFGIDKVLNTKGTTYKKLQLKDMRLNDEEKKSMMLQHPSLIKRPILVNGETPLLIGFDLEAYNEMREKYA